MTLKKNTTADSLHKLSGNFVILSTNKRKPKLEKLFQSFVAFITTSAALYKQSAQSTVCPTRYRTWHFFNNFTTNQDIATKFEADLPHCVRNVTTS